MNRLKDSSYDGRQESFTYDKVGNRLSKTTNGITDRYVYNVKNQLKELHQDSGTNFFTYDKQGNTIKEETQVGNNSYEYNNLNQQVKALTKEGNTLVSRYDTEGLRCEIEENEKLAKFIFHKENILVETDKDYNSISRFTRGYEVVAADIVDGDLGSNRYYYTHDEQGSTVHITGKEHELKNEYCYDAFGNVLESTELVRNRITYVGQQFDGITQQYYLRARFYNPVIERFTQEDVYRGDGLNLYGYCGGNPVVYYDPSGYAKRECPPSKTQAINDTKSIEEPSNNRKIFSEEKKQWTANRPKGTKQTYEVYQRNDIEWEHIRTDGKSGFIGKTNSQAAASGLAPQLSDGNFATLHHTGQDSRGALAEASTRYHGVGKYGQDILHSQYGKNKPNPKFPIDRKKFSVDTREYWKFRVENK
ncbi:hypothetical protein LGL08_21915 [Clostridium estertheticum]|uniref:RHS repeat-associated core domain-containing protein n=1 Tax=Clostridium estertheticum TaxID=238834 RepID=UPI001CF0D985|nr:RHS repeat-associated core domain-containing protein [Clostridium estertheticum]MCB2309227.1 hypothetical protein [Clostridium estertheticum]MCB2347642.1 hypothetical protein [Clostridium estertheticum]MCB2352183.1 hypothetical protein [Clostridium estertheticum]WAG45279.1 hypothetical protein LL127_17355 [Clostridium estertheticum]